MTEKTLCSPLRHLDLELVNELSKRETRSRETVLPPISVFRWWARRTSAVHSHILDAVKRDIGRRLLVADPFAGGGVIPLTALVKGHRAYAQDIDPWAAHGAYSMLSLPDPDEIREVSSALRSRVQDLLSEAYEGTSQGESTHTVHTFRVAMHICDVCSTEQALFPYAMVTRLKRRERESAEAYLACPAGHLFRAIHTEIHKCPVCARKTDPDQAYLRGRVIECAGCGAKQSLAVTMESGHRWKVVLVERSAGRSRTIDIPTADELDQADARWQVPRDLGAIPPGKETRVLLRHGFHRWTDLYPARQLHVTQHLLDEVSSVNARREVLAAVQLAIVGCTEMAGHASRWDRFYLKSYEAMARHRFAVTTFAVEPNVWGCNGYGRGTVERRLLSLIRASEWLRANGIRPNKVARRVMADTHPVDIGLGRGLDALVVEGSSRNMLLPSGRTDLILTDPPYHDDIQYSELSGLLRAWSGLDDGPIEGSVVAQGLGRDAGYEELLLEIFLECRRVLRPAGHLIMSFANRELAAWEALINALQRAGFLGSGFAIVHGENETDYAKRGGRHYTDNLLIDVVKPPSGTAVLRRWAPSDPIGSEAEFLHAVGRTLLDLGGLNPNWRDQLKDAHTASAFLSADAH